MIAGDIPSEARACSLVGLEAVESMEEPVAKISRPLDNVFLADIPKR